MLKIYYDLFIIKYPRSASLISLQKPKYQVKDIFMVCRWWYSMIQGVCKRVHTEKTPAQLRTTIKL